MRRNVLLALGLVCVFLVAGAPACGTNTPGMRWEQTFGDEFTNAYVTAAQWTNSCDWNYGVSCGTYNGGREWYSASQVGLHPEAGGSAVLVGGPGVDPNCYIPPPAAWAGSCTYKSGTLQTARPNGNDPNTAYKFKQTYGYFEARIKHPDIQAGFFGAFWLLPACRPGCGTTIHAEYDVTEYLTGRPAVSWMAAAGPPNRSQVGKVSWDLTDNGACAYGPDLGDTFHVYGLNWQPGFVAWYLDGIECGRYNHTTYNQPMYMIFNVQVDPEIARIWGMGITSTTAVDGMFIDWVRVYKEVPA